MTAEMRATMHDLRKAVKEQEHLEPKERFVPLFHVLTISGLSGTGKTTVGKMLALLYGISFEKIGERQRKKTQKETGGQVIGFAERSTRDDVDLDEVTRRHVRREKPIIVEGRLAGIVAKSERNNTYAQGEDMPVVVCVYFKSRNKIRMPRIYTRLIKENPDNANDPSFTLERITAQTVEREEKDRQLWRESHPEFGRINPFDSNATRQDERIYDVVVPTDNLSLVDTAMFIHNALVERDLVMRVSPNIPKEPLPASDVVFEA